MYCSCLTDVYFSNIFYLQISFCKSPLKSTLLKKLFPNCYCAQIFPIRQTHLLQPRDVLGEILLFMVTTPVFNVDEFHEPYIRCPHCQDGQQFISDSHEIIVYGSDSFLKRR